MKQAITILLALAAFSATAQSYNKTTDVNGNGDSLIPSFVISNQQGEDITLSMAYDITGLPRRDYFVITKNKCDGNPIYNVMIFTSNSPTDGMTNVKALMETPQGNLLIAGYHYDDINRIQQPMLIGVDNNGNCLWKKVYPVNQRDIVNAEINKISLCAVAGTQNQYFVVASADSDSRPGQDVVVNIIKVDGNGGNALANRKYYFGNDYNNICREYPGDIEYSPASNRYMITGYRLEIDQTGAVHHNMFFFSIDANLTVMPPSFRTFFYPSRPIDQDMIYDPATRNFAVVFTHDRNQFIPTINSVMGFMMVDAIINQIGLSKYYWYNNGIAHNSRSISRSNTGEFIIGASVFDANTGTRNPSIFKVNNTGAPTTALTRYNINDDVYFGHHTTTIDCNGNELYMLASEHNTYLRSIRADVSAYACGARTYGINYKDFIPTKKTYASTFQTVGQQRIYGLTCTPLIRLPRWCIIPPGDSYRHAAATAIAKLDGQNTGTALYPTILSVDNAKLTVENNSDASVKVEMYNIAGQLILSNGQVSTGMSEIELNTKGNLSEGIYLLKAYDAKGTLTNTTKVLITK